MKYQIIVRNKFEIKFYLAKFLTREQMKTSQILRLNSVQSKLIKITASASD